MLPKKPLCQSQTLQGGKMTELESLLCCSFPETPMSAASTEGPAGVKVAWYNCQSAFPVCQAGCVLSTERCYLTKTEH